MAGKGISIGVAADTREFSAGVKKGVIKPLDGIVDALEEVGKEGDDAGDKLERSLKDSQDETERLKKDYKQLGDAISDSSRTSSRDFSRNTKTATKGAAADLEELGRESKANFAQTLSSFDGTVEGTIDGIQGTLGGVTAGLTNTVALAGAAAGAAGLGLVVAAFVAASEASKQLEEDTQTAFDMMIEAGSRYFTEAQEIKLIQDTINDPEKYAVAKGLSEDYGISVAEAVRAVSLEGEEREKILTTLRDQKDLYGEVVEGENRAVDIILTKNKKALEFFDKEAVAQEAAFDRYATYEKAVVAPTVVNARQKEEQAIKDVNKAIADTPKTVPTTIVLDDSKLTTYKPKNIRVNVDFYSRNGARLP
jgi:hypothetical protein